MKKGVWRYFHKDEEYPDLISWVCEEIGENYTKKDPENPHSGILLLTKKIRITIDVYDE
jgi:hypothetical protein